MSITAKLLFGDNSSGRYSKGYQVSDFKCQVSRRHNNVRPDCAAKCDSMEITVVVPGKDDLNLYEWYTDGSCMSGCILVELPAPGPNQPAEQKQIAFENALCFALSEEYHIDSKFRRTLRLSIVAEEIDIDSVAFKSAQTCQD